MRLLPLALLAIASISSAKAETSCAGHYVDGTPPALAIPVASDKALCFEGFADLYSPETRTPVYVAEHLTPKSLADAVQLVRLDAFHAEPSLPFAARSEISDYQGKEYDRGHMAPSGDMPTTMAQHESFTLANMVPQDANSNRGLWSRIEETVRRQVVLATDGYVVTGPIFAGQPLMLNGRVRVPDRLFKAFYRPAGGVETKVLIGAYVVDNRPNSDVEIISLDALKAETGIDAFPALSAEMHAAVTLPAIAGK